MSIDVAPCSVGRRRTTLTHLHLVTLLFTIVGLVSITGCSALGESPEQPAESALDQPDHSDQIARTAAADMAGVIAQLLEPVDTTLQVPRDMGLFRETLMVELVERGFGVQQVRADQGAWFVQHDVSADVGVDGQPAQRHAVTIGDIELARTYRELDGAVLPAGPLSVAGRRTTLTLDDSAYREQLANPEAVSRVIYMAPMQQGVVMPAISLLSDDVISGVRASVGRTDTPPSLQALNSSRVEVNNLFFGQTNFASIEQRYAPVSRDVIVFGDDSLRLGDDGKQLIREIVDTYREKTDLVSLVGCSNGPTAYEGGNEGLALGRSRRVADELLALGVPRDRILDQGCWAPVSAGDRFPGRGVVVELLRDKP